MPETTDKDREDEARKFLLEIDSVEGIFDDYERNALPIVLARDARLKAEALSEAAERVEKYMDGHNPPHHYSVGVHNALMECAAIFADESPKRGLKETVDSIRERWGKDFDALTDEPQTACTWTESPEGYWSTSCGRSWTFIEGGPEDNRVNYCHGCGKPVRLAEEPNKEE